MDRAAVLSQAGFFSGLSASSRSALVEVCQEKELKKRQVLFVEGEEGNALHVVARGTIQLYKSAPDGNEVVIKVAQPGEAFAEVVLFEEPRYPVSALALRDSTVLLFPRPDIHRLLEQPEFRTDFIAMLMRKQRYLAARIFDLTTKDAGERLLAFLRENLGGAPRGALALSKKDVAAAIGTTPETLSRLVQRLEEDGTLSWKGKFVELRGRP